MSTRNPETHTVGCGLAYAVRKRFQTLADCDDERPVDGGHVDPFARQVLGLKASVMGRLEEVGCQHAIFVRTNALALFAAFGVQSGGVGVFDDFELVLLVGVEEAVEGGRWEEEGLGNEGREGC